MTLGRLVVAGGDVSPGFEYDMEDGQGGVGVPEGTLSPAANGGDLQIVPLYWELHEGHERAEVAFNA
ncbi:hypothetical protein [Streptomyces sp. CJ_13]|uniref:hypothetical protein n=1 Tax=Streptomyces sp. CJ_13 TaxID=2724943 RepID=UPI001BDCA6C4|nr:hypothetical protein [Streptomyces sp. CJ_13]